MAEHFTFKLLIRINLLSRWRNPNELSMDKIYNYYYLQLIFWVNAYVTTLTFAYKHIHKHTIKQTRKHFVQTYTQTPRTHNKRLKFQTTKHFSSTINKY